MVTMTATPDLALIPQRIINVRPLPTTNGIAAEVTIDGLELRWQVLAWQTGDDEWTAWFSHSQPEDQWSNLLRAPIYKEHPVPRTNRDLIAYCRWFFAPRASIDGSTS